MTSDHFTFPPPPPPPPQVYHAPYPNQSWNQNRGSSGHPRGRGGRGGGNLPGHNFSRGGNRGRGSYNQPYTAGVHYNSYQKPFHEERNKAQTGQYAPFPSLESSLQHQNAALGHYTQDQGASFSPGANDSQTNARLDEAFPTQSSEYPTLSGQSPSGSTPETLRHNGKRTHAGAFSKASSQQTKSNVAPAVPSFYQSLLPPLSTSSTNGNEKSAEPQTKPKSSRNNLLGLTPKAVDESSDEENVEDEESNLAAAVNNTSVFGLEISHKGSTIMLRSPAEIARWVADRKRRWPTKARVGEALQKKAQAVEARRQEKAQMEEAKRQKQLAAREAQEKEKQKRQEKKEKKQEKKQASTAKREVERLRGLLAIEKQKVAAAEARAKAPLEDRASIGQRDSSPTAKSEILRPPNPQMDEHGARSDFLQIKPTNPAPPSQEPAIESSQAITCEPEGSLSSTTSDLSSSDTDDYTSSSGSSASEEDSDGEIPEQTTSKREQPQRKLPNHPRKPKICGSFLRTGRCRYKGRCRLSHDLPKRNRGVDTTKQKDEGQPGRKTRVSLYQRLVDQEKAKEEENNRKISSGDS